MESFKSISDYPAQPCAQMTPEKLALYNDYINAGIQSAMMVAREDLLARANKTMIRFHSGR